MARLCSSAHACRYSPCSITSKAAKLLMSFFASSDRKQLSEIVHSDPDILDGTPVFVGTRVPVQSLFDYLEGGETLDEFLRQFPSVRRHQAISALDLARATL